MNHNAAAANGLDVSWSGSARRDEVLIPPSLVCQSDQNDINDMQLSVLGIQHKSNSPVIASQIRLKGI